MNRPVIHVECAACDGSGCEECENLGWVHIPCEACDGAGAVEGDYGDATCARCGGTGDECDLRPPEGPDPDVDHDMRAQREVWHGRA